ncbi:PP2C family protein-serine/threonine phosphatase [Cryptosporangium arvum]|uniref:Serine/threonine protein phosphatase PstP n=1 Tax=Cryptosporangium arvum DSM 44712 TaxID=927661 RepID=A0A010ZK25_9ACTN|nr:PP2C family serine/threonine-protein phosphatase [Cryptosporangium arvum]EXG79019.1 serine/threonine protein phosphatase [Cryptosporangium arvum DSM 44712]
MSLTLRYAAKSDRGLIREGNEDSVYAGPRLLAVADGMGGMAAGEVASNIVVRALEPLDEDVSAHDLVDALRGAIGHANQQLRDAVDANPALEGMGTTLTALLFSGTRLALAHVGDSRAYVLRNSELHQITRDDTYVQMLVDEGRITADEANTHPQRSLLTRALDGREVEPEFSVREARPGDRYLLCSDGLSSVVSMETIEDAMRIDDPAQVANRLIQLALRGGGPDNITVIVADILDDRLADNAPVVGGAAARDRTTSATADTAAGRAALATPPRPTLDDNNYGVEEEDEPVESGGRHRRRTTALLTVLALAALAAGGYAAWHYTQQQYYVGTTEAGHVAIYRGVSGSLAGLEFSTLQSDTDLRVDDLQQVARESVEQTIPAENREDAYTIVDNLRQGQVLPWCHGDATPTPTPSVTPSTTSSASPTPSESTSPNSSATPSSTASASPSAPAATASRPAGEILPAGESDKPGENCRVAR